MMIEQVHDESMQDTSVAIAQLATSTASDCGTVATLTTTNAKLVTQIEADHALRATQEQDRDPKKQDQACMTGTTTHKNNKQQQLLLVAWLPGGEIAH
jgi:anthranilate phosphoribosyltransferase